MDQILYSDNHVPTNYEEQDYFRSQKRFKLDSNAAAGKTNNFSSREDFKHGGISTRETKLQEQIKPGGGSKVEVHLANAELWKELNAIGNEMSIVASAG